MGTLQSVSTLLTALGLPYRPTTAGTAVVARWARLPSSDLSSAVFFAALVGAGAAMGCRRRNRTRNEDVRGEFVHAGVGS